MGIGMGSGKSRALDAAHAGVCSPLLEAWIHGAKGIIINITGGSDLTLHEVNEAAESIYEVADEDANIIFGAVIDETMDQEIKITVIATGFDNEASEDYESEEPQTESRSVFPPMPGIQQPERTRHNSNERSRLEIPPFLKQRRSEN